MVGFKEIVFLILYFAVYFVMQWMFTSNEICFMLIFPSFVCLIVFKLLPWTLVYYSQTPVTQACVNTQRTTLTHLFFYLDYCWII